jgi:hypothetical protein
MAKRFLTPIGLHVSTTDPASGSNGQAYFNSATNEMKIYYDGQWNSITAGGGGGGSETESGVQLSTSWWLGA